MNKKLFSLMADKGLTQAELADKAGVSRTAIYGIVNKGRKPNIVTTGKIAKALGVEPYEIYKIAVKEAEKVEEDGGTEEKIRIVRIAMLEAMQAKCITQTDLAKGTGLSRQWINKLINHGGVVTANTARKISLALGIKELKLFVRQKPSTLSNKPSNNMRKDESTLEARVDECARAYEDAKKKRARIMRVVNSDLRDLVLKLAADKKEFQEIHNMLYTALSEYTANCIRVARDAWDKTVTEQEKE